MAETFQDFIARERERPHGEREAIFTQQRELETKLTAINNELWAIDAYETAKSGKPMPASQARKKQSAVPATRGRRSSKRAGILAVLEDNPHGLTRGEILEKMGLKGNKTGEMSVSNALTALTKSGRQVVRRDKRYIGQIG
jgi:hypothetical protein